MSDIDEDEFLHLARARHAEDERERIMRECPPYTPPPLPLDAPALEGGSEASEKARTQLSANRLGRAAHSQLFAMLETSTSFYIEAAPVSLLDLAMVASHDGNCGERTRAAHMRRIATTMHKGAPWIGALDGPGNWCGREADAARRGAAERESDLAEAWASMGAVRDAVDDVRGGALIDTALLCRMHGQAFGGTARSKSIDAGKLRTYHSGITSDGEVIYMATPPKNLAGSVANLMAYIQADDTGEHALTRAAVAHAQFETIHPFADGNGRVGRMLVQLMLCREGVIRKPDLPLSACVNARRADYYRLLKESRGEGGWRGFVDFFVAAIGDAAEQAEALSDQFQECRMREGGEIGARALKPTATALEVYSRLARGEVLQVVSAARALNRSEIVVRRALQYWEGLGVAVPLTDRTQRDVLYGHGEILGAINQAYQFGERREPQA